MLASAYSREQELETRTLPQLLSSLMWFPTEHILELLIDVDVRASVTDLQRPK